LETFLSSVWGALTAGACWRATNGAEQRVQDYESNRLEAPISGEKGDAGATSSVEPGSAGTFALTERPK